MPVRKLKFEKGCYYHIYNRGVNRQPIFFYNENYSFLLKRIKRYLYRDRQEMIAYCLMPNHYHFLIRQDNDVEISRTIQAIFNSYSKAVNLQIDRSGTLFEGRFKALLIDDETYLLHLCRYIHRNPIDAYPPLIKKLEDWRWSNYPEWAGLRKGNLVDHEFIAEYFQKADGYQQFVYETPSAKVLQRFEKYMFEK